MVLSDEQVVDQQIWRGWVQRGKRRGEVMPRGSKWVATLLALIICGWALYLLAARSR